MVDVCEHVPGEVRAIHGHQNELGGRLGVPGLNGSPRAKGVLFQQTQARGSLSNQVRAVLPRPDAS
eukprot:9863625-Alexandrium_andersonii.AAC.1